MIVVLIQDFFSCGGLLQGVCVVELIKVWVGLYIGKLLVFFGVEVICVESCSVFDFLCWYNGDDIDGVFGYQVVNFQKFSVQIDICKFEGKELLFKFLVMVDVFVENLWFGVIVCVELDYEVVWWIKLDIVYLLMGMYGNDGLLVYQSGYVLCFVVLLGVSVVVGYEGELLIGMNICYGDLMMGVVVVFVVVIVLLYCQCMGEGQFIDVLVVEVLSSMIGDMIMIYVVIGIVLGCDGNCYLEMVLYGVYLCCDGEWISIVVCFDVEWWVFVVVIGGDVLVGDVGFVMFVDWYWYFEVIDVLLFVWIVGYDVVGFEVDLQWFGIVVV